MNAKLVAALAAALLSSPLLKAQLEPTVVFQEESVVLDSGYIDNPGFEPAVVFRQVLDYPTASLLRLHFGTTNLPEGSVLRITSAKDGAAQRMDGESVVEYGHRSALFNGGKVLVELVAGPETEANRLMVTRAALGRGVENDSLCGGADDRILSYDNRSGRVSPGCSAWMIAPDIALTAGHCGATGQFETLSFRVPLSSDVGEPQAADPDDQYPFFYEMSSGSGGIGNDWAIGRVGRNSNTGLLPHERYEEGWYPMGPVPEELGTRLRITGYGTVPTGGDLPLEQNAVQKTHVGRLNNIDTLSLGYRVDTTGGNSGSPVLNEVTGQAVAIHTHGGCSAGSNWGTRLDHPDLLEALLNLGEGPVSSGSAESYGAPCPGANAFIPELRVMSEPRIGRDLELVATGLPLFQPGAMLIGGSRTRWSQAGLDLPASLDAIGSFGCFLHVSPDLPPRSMETGASVLSTSLPIPARQQLIGDTFYLQYLFLDPTLGYLRTTNAVEITIGG